MISSIMGLFFANIKNRGVTAVKINKLIEKIMLQNKFLNNEFKNVRSTQIYLNLVDHLILINKILSSNLYALN